MPHGRPLNLFNLTVWHWMFFSTWVLERFLMHTYACIYMYLCLSACVTFPMMLLFHGSLLVPPNQQPRKRNTCGRVSTNHSVYCYGAVSLRVWSHRNKIHSCNYTCSHCKHVPHTCTLSLVPREIEKEREDGHKYLISIQRSICTIQVSSDANIVYMPGDIQLVNSYV
jgi:hypothetical protein